MSVSGPQRLDTGDRRQLADAAQLFVDLLPESGLAQLGPAFVRSFYLQRLSRSGLLACDVALHGDRVVGLIVYTEKPRGFLRQGALAQPLAMTAALAGALVRDPRRLRGVFTALTRSGQLPADPGDAYLLAIAVDPGARELRDAHGVRLSAALMLRMLGDLKQREMRRLIGAVHRDNTSAVRFYRSMGLGLTESELVGADHLEIRCDLETFDGARPAGGAP